ncbi:DUF3800 domain-containing protein [Desulfallas thermosapovorans]|uniref:Uncharacterized protein DUF3800 n=1 Tax=Desulfallas thermosapovorans DSM 6562 TaxID=1121431 RepID=A0A5S4ZND1_9FIRM|nr:DUF3800 domain-containing protein [Desulfallas thermosapovorans]TYO92805.1 uncharacterized protein DUF3800 [Desulfallas thermosapovorans DSM 6562]
METIYNVYCDESCHLENDHQKVMVLGAIWCPKDSVNSLNKRIRSIKIKHNISYDFEIKWTKVSPGKIDFYLELISMFFSENNLHFRALIVDDKTKLRHDYYNQDHDTWYYKVYFTMLKVILNPYDKYRIYLDIKDTRSSNKVKKLHDVLCNNMYDFSRQIIERVQTVRSEEIELIQLADLLIGVVGYENRGLKNSMAKTLLVDRVKELSGYSLTKSTLLRENKFNLFHWQASEVG